MKARQLWCRSSQVSFGVVLAWLGWVLIATQPALAQDDGGLRGSFAALSSRVMGPDALSDPRGAINWQSEIHGQIRVEAAFRDQRTTEVRTCDEIEDYGFNRFICRIYLEPLGDDETYWDYAFWDFSVPGNVCIRRIHSKTGAIEERGCNLPLPFSWHFEGQDGGDFDVPVVAFVRSQEKAFDRLVLGLSPISADAGLFARAADLDRAGSLISIMRQNQTLRFDPDFSTTFQPSPEEVGDDSVAQKPAYERRTLSCLNLAWGAGLQVDLWLGAKRLGDIWSKELALEYERRCLEEIAQRAKAGGPLGVYNRDAFLATTVRRDGIVAQL